MTAFLDSKVISEVNAILNQLNEDSLNKIPKKILDEFKRNATVNVDYIDLRIPLEELNLQEETKEILAVISYTYFCNEEERKQWNIDLLENEKKYQEELHKKYDMSRIFEDNNSKEEIVDETSDQNTSLVEYKETFLKKIWKKITHFFNGRKK